MTTPAPEGLTIEFPGPDEPLPVERAMLAALALRWGVTSADALARIVRDAARRELGIRVATDLGGEG